MQDWLAHRARTTPDREALVNASSGNAWAYATLNETVEEMAGRLSTLGVAEGDHLGAVLKTGVEGVCLIHAAMRLGAVLVPLSPEFTPPELVERIDRAAVNAVVCDETSEAQVAAAIEQGDSWHPIFTIDDAEAEEVTPLSAAEPTEFEPANWTRQDTQLLLFTSGTTGSAKVVQLTMGNLLASAVASAFRLGIDPEDRWLVPLSLHHMGGIAPILRSTLYGTTAIVREHFDPGGTVDDLREHEATCVSLVPTMLRRMLSARGTLPDSLRFVLVGGAPCPKELIKRCRDYSVPICPTYGMTETASQVATARHTDAYEHPESVGRPLLWTTVTVVASAGAPVEPGETGELVISGPTVTPGYYDDPTMTGEAIGAYGLHTGDVGYRDEQGRLFVLNRLDDRILTGGENVDPGEVVGVMQSYPNIEAAAVVGLDDEEWGERVAALVVPADTEAGLDIGELEPFLRERLAGFKLPRTIGTIEELPRTVSGTIERDAVRARLQEGAVETIDQHKPSDALPEADTQSVQKLPHEEETDDADETDSGTHEDSDSIAAETDDQPAPETGLEDEDERETADEEDPVQPLIDASDVNEQTELELDVDGREERDSSSSVREETAEQETDVTVESAAETAPQNAETENESPTGERDEALEEVDAVTEDTDSEDTDEPANGDDDADEQ